MYPILNVLISNLKLVFEKFKSQSRNWKFWVKKYQLSNLNKILPATYSEDSNLETENL